MMLEIVQNTAAQAIYWQLRQHSRHTFWIFLNDVIRRTARQRHAETRRSAMSVRCHYSYLLNDVRSKDFQRIKHYVTTKVLKHPTTPPTPRGNKAYINMSMCANTSHSTKGMFTKLEMDPFRIPLLISHSNRRSGADMWGTSYSRTVCCHSNSSV